MSGNEMVLTGDQWSLISVGRAIENCRTFKIWSDIFRKENFEIEDLMAMGKNYPHIAEATLLFSLFSVRRLEEFLRDKPQSDDLHWHSFGINRDFVQQGESRLLSDAERRAVNKSIAHLTAVGDMDFDEQEDAVKTLERIYPFLDRLEAEVARVSQEANTSPEVPK